MEIIIKKPKIIPKVNTTLKKLALYPILSNKLDDCLITTESPRIRDLLDRTLWASLYGTSLLSEFNMDEFRDLYHWTSRNLKPNNFPVLVEDKLKNDLGLVFNGTRYCRF